MRRLSKLSILLFPALALALLAGPATVGGASRTASTKRVSVKDNVFSPRSVTVRPGTKVIWAWKGFAGHTVTFRKVPSGVGRIKGTGVLDEGARFSHTFRKRGTYRYICRIHVALGMRGTVVVK